MELDVGRDGYNLDEPEDGAGWGKSWCNSVKPTPAHFFFFFSFLSFVLFLFSFFVLNGGHGVDGLRSNKGGLHGGEAILLPVWWSKGGHRWRQQWWTAGYWSGCANGECIGRLGGDLGMSRPKLIGWEEQCWTSCRQWGAKIVQGGEGQLPTRSATASNWLKFWGQSQTQNAGKLRWSVVGMNGDDRYVWLGVRD